MAPLPLRLTLREIQPTSDGLCRWDLFEFEAGAAPQTPWQAAPHGFAFAFRIDVLYNVSVVLREGPKAYAIMRGCELRVRRVRARLRSNCGAAAARKTRCPAGAVGARGA